MDKKNNKIPSKKLEKVQGGKQDDQKKIYYPFNKKGEQKDS